MGENHGAADLLVCMARVNTQADGSFDGFVELGLRGGKNGFNALAGIIKFLLVNQLNAVLIFLTMLHASFPP